jgi:hypothetical protein
MFFRRCGNRLRLKGGIGGGGARRMKIQINTHQMLAFGDQQYNRALISMRSFRSFAPLPLPARSLSGGVVSSAAQGQALPYTMCDWHDHGTMTSCHDGATTCRGSLSKGLPIRLCPPSVGVAPHNIKGASCRSGAVRITRVFQGFAVRVGSCRFMPSCHAVRSG